MGEGNVMLCWHVRKSRDTVRKQDSGQWQCWVGTVAVHL